VGPYDKSPRASGRSPATASPWTMSGARSSAGSSLRGLRGERRWAREGRTSRMSEPRLRGSERMRWMSCAGSFELFDQTAHHHLARLHEPHPFFPPLFQQMLGDVAVDR